MPLGIMCAAATPRGSAMAYSSRCAADVDRVDKAVALAVLVAVTEMQNSDASAGLLIASLTSRPETDRPRQG